VTSATQQESRAAITRRDFQRRGATEAQRGAMRGVYGRSHPDGGINTAINAELPEAKSTGDRWCERCERTGRVMHWMGTFWFRCCGWLA
jgi:hypothetical protein